MTPGMNVDVNVIDVDMKGFFSSEFIFFSYFSIVCLSVDFILYPAIYLIEYMNLKKKTRTMRG